MPFYLSYSMSSGSGRQEAATAEKAAELFAQLRLAGATIHSVKDHKGFEYELRDLIPDPMELAEIEYLSGTIRLLEARLSADGNGSMSQHDEDTQLLKLELERAKAQLARVLDHHRK